MMRESEYELAGELEQELEDELELQEEATELEPLFTRAEPTLPFRDGGWGQTDTCPSSTRTVVSGFSRYSNAVTSLPRDAQTRVRKVASLILRSFRSGCQPIAAVRLVGHADYDPLQEGQEPGFLVRIGRARALAIRRALELLINNPTISSRIAWDTRGMGARQLVVRNPATERERRWNRRVDIALSTRNRDGSNPVDAEWALAEREDDNSCKMTWAVPEFAPGSSKVQKFQQQHIRDITTRVVTRVVREVKGKPDVGIDFQFFFEGHVDKKTDPQPYGALDADRATHVSWDFTKPFEDSMKKMLPVIGYGAQYKFSSAGSSRPFSSKSSQNRRVVICVNWKIRPALVP